jgi:hypothetical protein
MQTYGGEATTDRARLLGAEVKREVLLLLVELAQVLALLLVCDRQDACDALPDGVTISLARAKKKKKKSSASEYVYIKDDLKDVHPGELSRRTASDLLHTELEELLLKLSELLGEVVLRPGRGAFHQHIPIFS